MSGGSALAKGLFLALLAFVRLDYVATGGQHELFDHITLIEGGSTEPAIVEQVRAAVAGAERVMVVLDSNHTKAHVLAELDAYSGLVTEGCYLVATDGVMEWVADVPRGTPAWRDDNPTAAVESWLPGHPEFVLEEPPPFTFNEGPVTERVTHWPSAYLRRT